MVGSISNVNTLQVLRATQAFKSAIRTSLNSINEAQIDDVEVKLSLSPESQNLLNKTKDDSIRIDKNMMSQDISTIKDFAHQQGMNDITNEDIEYAIRYGRSILVDRVG